MKLKFISLASGSSGNSFYLGTTSYGILIDAGIGIRTIKKVLRERGIALESILGIFVTHDHADHIRAVGNLSEGCNIPVYTTDTIHKGMQKNYCMTKKVSPVNRRIIQKGEATIVRDLHITPFEIPHDGSDNVGYSIQCEDTNFCFITDIGHITDTVKHYVAQAHYLILEANYDEQMLAEGPYPPLLQARIRGANGHLSNREAGEFLANHYPPQVKQIWLCHLSKENNKPHLAYHAVAQALEGIGKRIDHDVRLMALPRTSPTQIFEVNNESKTYYQGTLFD
jgi:phosphoribosyl 1,2-cyclic phosphodiesterase